MKIKVNLNRINEAIAEIENYKRMFEDKQRRFLQRLAEIGVDEASVRFSKAAYPGTNDVVVNKPVWLEDNRVAVRAEGAAITFIEFGAGVHYPDMHEKAAEFGFERGGYGLGLGKNDWWLYRGEVGQGGLAKVSKANPGLKVTHGNPPNRCMWETDKVIREKILEVAKEVFGND